MQKVADSAAGAVPLTTVDFDSAIDLREVGRFADAIRAERAAEAQRARSAERAQRLRRKAGRLPLRSNGRRKLEAEIAWLEGRGPKPVPKGA